MFEISEDGEASCEIPSDTSGTGDAGDAGDAGGGCVPEYCNDSLCADGYCCFWSCQADACVQSCNF